MTAERLSEENLEAFEVRAEQKLQDFAEYVGILSDPEKGSALRKRAREQLLELFVDPTTRISSFPGPEGETRSYSVERLTKELEEASSAKLRISLEEVKSSPFQRTEEERYEGKLEFRMIREYQGKEGGTQEGEYEVRTLMKRVPKRFGDEEELVWELFLGQMRGE